MKKILLPLAILLSPYVSGMDITCSNDLTGISIREEVSVEFEEDMNRYHVFVSVPIFVKGHELSAIYMNYEKNVGGSYYQHLIGAPLRWVNDEQYARTKIVISNTEFTPSIHLEYGVCGPTHDFQLNVR